MSKQQERDIEILEIVLRNKQHVNFFADNELGAIQRLLDRVKELEQRLADIKSHWYKCNEGIYTKIGGPDKIGPLTDREFKEVVKDVVMPLLISEELDANWGMLLDRLCRTVEQYQEQRAAALKLADELENEESRNYGYESKHNGYTAAGRIRAIFEPKDGM